MTHEQLFLGNAPAIGFDQAALAAPTVAMPSPWALALVTSAMGAAVGWTIEEVAHHVRGKRRAR